MSPDTLSWERTFSTERSVRVVCFGVQKDPGAQWIHVAIVTDPRQSLWILDSLFVAVFFRWLFLFVAFFFIEEKAKRRLFSIAVVLWSGIWCRSRFQELVGGVVRTRRGGLERAKHQRHLVQERAKDSQHPKQFRAAHGRRSAWGARNQYARSNQRANSATYHVRRAGSCGFEQRRRRCCIERDLNLKLENLISSILTFFF